MKRCFFLVLLLLCLKNGWSQNTNLDYKLAIKVYNLTTAEVEEWSQKLSDSSSTYFVYSTSDARILHPTVAFQWKTKRNNFHEIELTNFSIAKTGNRTEVKNTNSPNSFVVSGSDVTTTAIALRYEYILNFFKSKERKLVPSVGFGASPYFKQHKFSPVVSTSIPSSDSYIGARAIVTPRLTYYIKSRFFIDLNIPLCVADFYSKIEKNVVPGPVAGASSSSTINFQAFPKVFSGRIGIGLKL